MKAYGCSDRTDEHTLCTTDTIACGAKRDQFICYSEPRPRRHYGTAFTIDTRFWVFRSIDVARDWLVIYPGQRDVRRFPTHQDALTYLRSGVL